MFMSQFDGGFSSSQLSQPESGPSPAKNRDPQGSVPATVKQISQASPSSSDDKSNFNIDGVDVTNVKMVGMVIDKIEKVTDVSFTLDDGTGRIGCKRWLSEAFDRQQMECIEDGIYVMLVGHLRTFKGNPEILAFSVRPVTNFDEVTHHYVECIYQHIQNKKSQGADLMSQSTMESSQTTPIKTEPNGFHSSQSSQPSIQMNVDGLNDLDQRVLNYLQQSFGPAKDNGVHLDEIAKHLKLPKDKITECITRLEDEGLIYSTIDEFHFKSTA